MNTKHDNSIIFQPIGIISTPHQTEKGTPVQPFEARDIAGEVKIFPEFRDGLKDLIGFQYIWLIYFLHRASFSKLSVIPYREVVERGLFATRSPSRPNPIGLSAVKLIDLDIEEGILNILDVDMLDSTPLLDIKPYISRIDSHPGSKGGWFEEVSEDRNS